jgi:hypothetical protein
MTLSLLSWFRLLYSLDTLDTRFTVPANTPVKVAAEDTRSGSAKDARSNTVANNASPSKWGTPEFFFYYIIFLIAVPLMFKTVVDVSQGTSAHSVLESSTKLRRIARITSYIFDLLSFTIAWMDTRA